ncbi:MAG: MATE family efflux transporter [Clostridiales Family XIII bacterium]|jgi:putative MATE family efflux protein|nr:MATE family efflux transporter [Clostridiales Family XIII bacterium]
MKEGAAQGGGESLARLLLRVALPISAQSLLTSSLNLVDNLIVGRLGETELASVGLANQIFFVHWMILFGFTSGTAAFMAQFWGRRDLKNIRRTTGAAVTANLCLSTAFFLAAMLFPERILGIFTNIPTVIEMGAGFVRINAPSFLLLSFTVPLTAALRATQQTSIPLRISVFVLGTNTFLNYLLVFGSLGAPALGVRGSACATVAARSVELALLLFVVFARKNRIAGRPREFFSWSGDLLRRIIRNAWPTTLNETLWGAGTSMYNAAYGRISVTAFAAVQAGWAIQNIFIMACFSLGDAMLIIVGEKLGRGERAEAIDTASRILRVCVFLGLAAGGLLFLLSRRIVGLFELTDEGARYALLILMVYSAFLVVKVMNGTIVAGVLRCGGDTRFAMMGEVCCVWLIGVPLAFIGARALMLPVYWVVLLVHVQELTELFIMLRRVRSKKWAKTLIKGVD